MKLAHFSRPGPALFAWAMATPAVAADEEAQFWATQSLSIGLDEATHVQFDAVERARSPAFGGDQLQLAGAVDHNIGSGFSIGGGAVYQRAGRLDEFRLQQQLGFASGPVVLRTRLEQRFQEGVGPTVWRLRQRVQLTETLDTEGDWAIVGSVEGFFNLNQGTPGSQTGFIALRSQVGVRHKFSDHVSGTLAYVRQHEFRDGAPDRIGHAPVIGLAFSF